MTDPVEEIRRALDSWALDNGLGLSPEHQDIAAFIHKRIAHRYSLPGSPYQSLLLWIEGDRYTNVRLVDSSGSPEEALWPTDPETDEPVSEAVADAVWYLPRPDSIPDL